MDLGSVLVICSTCFLFFIFSLVIIKNIPFDNKKSKNSTVELKFSVEDIKNGLTAYSIYKTISFNRYINKDKFIVTKIIGRCKKEASFDILKNKNGYSLRVYGKNVGNFINIFLMNGVFLKEDIKNIEDFIDKI